MDSTGKIRHRHRRPVLHRQHRSGQSDLRRGLAAEVHAGRHHLRRQRQHHARRRRHLALPRSWWRDRAICSTPATQVTVDRTQFTFNPLSGGVYTVTYADDRFPGRDRSAHADHADPVLDLGRRRDRVIDIFNDSGGLTDIMLGVTGRLYTYDPVQAPSPSRKEGTSTTAPVHTGLAFASSSLLRLRHRLRTRTAAYTVNGTPMYPYSASTPASPATHPLMTPPQMFTVDGNFYIFDQDASGNYVSVTGDGQTYPVNPYQFSINGDGLHHQHQRSALHGRRRRQRLSNDRRQHPVRHQRRAVHHHSQRRAR